MAYASRYIFQFGSANGTDYRITVSQDGYEGEPLLRHLGGSPVLRRDRSGHVWGTSLEIPAECRVDTEFAALYTSNPKEFLVTLDRSNAPSLDRVTVWTGYVSTELYSEPDIAPPYDVRITATDCFGELKSTAFVGESRTILAHLEHILAKTGLSLPIRTASALAADSVAASALFSTVTVDYSYLDGENDYDVLQAILSALNADITRQGDAWIIFRQTDISSLEGTSRTGQRLVRLRNESSGAATSAPISAVTSMQHGDIWPVGNLSSSIDPARSHGVIRAPYHVVPSALENPDMDTDSAWIKGSGVNFEEGGWYSLPEDGTLSQSIALSDPDYYIALKLKARSTIWYRQGDRMSSEYTLKIRVKATCSDRQGNAYTMYFGNYDTPAQGTGHRLFESPFWQNTEVWNELTVPAPSSNDERDLGEYELVIPFSTGARQTFVNWNSLEVYIYNPESDTPILISHCSLHAVDIADGEQVTIYLDNGARGSADDVELGLSDTGDYSGVTPFFQGFATVSGSAVTMWSTGLLEADSYLRVMAQDHAMGWALPRLRKDGVLNVPKNSEIPLFTESGGIDYIIETFRWDLQDDELNMSMVSLPAVSLQVESMETAQYNTGSNGNGGGSSSNTSMAQTLSGYATLSDLALKLNIADLKALEFSAGSFGGNASYDTRLAVLIKIPTTLDHIADGSNRKLSDYAKASELTALNTRLTTVEGSLTSFDTRITSLEDLFEIDPSTGAIRTKHDRPFYSNSWISALGAGSGSGGGGGADLSDVWESLRTNSDDFADEKIDWGHINLGVATEGTGNVVSGLTLTKNGTSATLTAQFMNISSWALASQKPTYSYTEIQGLSEILAEKASVSWVSPEPASGNEAGLTVNGVTKTLLKSSAIEYSDKAVGLISETDFRSALNTFFPIP